MLIRLVGRPMIPRGTSLSETWISDSGVLKSKTSSFYASISLQKFESLRLSLTSGLNWDHFLPIQTLLHISFLSVFTGVPGVQSVNPWLKLLTQRSLATPKLDLLLISLSYLSKKRLWENTLSDRPEFYSNKLYRALQVSDSPFIPYAEQRPKGDESWRRRSWTEAELRLLLSDLSWKDMALLRAIAQAGGAMRQDRIIEALPFLRGKTSASLRAAKSHVNAACKGSGKAPILAEGTGTGSQRIHQINPGLGDLRDVVIQVALRFSIPDGVM